jgi:membrane-bound lytic murein transglycosylase D
LAGLTSPFRATVRGRIGLMTHRLSHSFSIVPALLLLAACASHPPTQQGTAPVATTELSPAPVSSTAFPRPPELEPQIAFWRNVYGVWSMSQVVVHDDRYLNLVYEVVTLPGGIYDSYTPMQQDLIRERRGYWQYRLRELENRVASGISLDSDEQALVTRIVRSGGSTNAIYGVSERLRVQRGQRERFRRGLEISGRYDALFKNIFRQAGLPAELAYLPHVESSFQAHARSSAGAVGVWQFTRGAAHTFMNVNSAVDERLDPVASARGAARYLRFSYDKLGSWPLALTAYNHGIGGMQRARDAFGTDFMRIV